MMHDQTRIVKINTRVIELDKIRIIVDVLKNEGVIVYPTDTFYGLGANFFSKKAEERICRLKKRKSSKPLSVVISDLGMLHKIAVNIPPVFAEISAEFWPGPLTLIFKGSPLLPKELLSPEGSIAVRLPAHSWLRALVKHAAFPITSTSANISGEKEIARPKKTIKTFYGKVDLIVDGGATPGILPSTVVSLTTEKPRILREGAVPVSVLRKYIG